MFLWAKLLHTMLLRFEVFGKLGFVVIYGDGAIEIGAPEASALEVPLPSSVTR
jgi:hypothetical protein